MKPAAGDTPQSEALSDWSHMRETINMLYLAVCQIEATMNDSNKSVDTLTESFTKLATHTGDFSDQIQKISQVEELEVFKQDINTTAASMQENINDSIHAFQFYDRVCQRLDHVARSLEKVSSLMEDEKLVFQESEWRKLQDKIKSSYTMDAERIMFEYIMRGGSVSEALEIYRHHFEAERNKKLDDDFDEIELF